MSAAPSDPITPQQARLMAEVAHELRTPLNAVLGFADILRERLHGPLDERYVACAQMIHEAGRHMLSVVGDLQGLAPVSPRKPIDAREPVLAALRLTRQAFDAKAVALHEALSAEPLTLTIDPRALTQIALNLLTNALKFTSPGGAAFLTLARSDDAVVLTVADTGIGFAADPPEGLAGAGLGLALVRALAEANGGELTIADSSARGARVEVRLPAAGP